MSVQTVREIVPGGISRAGERCGATGDRAGLVGASLAQWRFANEECACPFAKRFWSAKRMKRPLKVAGGKCAWTSTKNTTVLQRSLAYQ